MALAHAVPDTRDLEGRKEGENRPSIQSRDFFLDSVTLFVVGAILALSAIDVVSEFIRRSRVQCFFDDSVVNESVKNVEDYVNEKCAASLPPAEYLPAFIAVHAILILAPHYIWLNVFGANLDSFYHLVSRLSRTRDPNTGDYPESNYVISRQLDTFSSGAYRSNLMYRLYFWKIITQLFLCFTGLLLFVLWFREFSDSFTCPGDMESTLSDDWPLTGKRVKCVFTSLRLLHKIWFIYLILLTAAILCLLLSFLTLLITDHTKELGLDKVSEFFFQTSLQFQHYTPQLSLGQKLYHAALALIPRKYSEPRSPYRIQTDYDFLLVKLFRTDGGLATVLREVHLLRLLKEMNSSDLAAVTSHITNTKRSGTEKVTTRTLKDTDLGWSEISIEDEHIGLPIDTAELLLPQTIRGVVMGMSAFCVGSRIRKPEPEGYDPNRVLCGALCIVFDSESIGFASALARVFKKVAVINFSKSYTDYENPVRVKLLTPKIISITAPHDIVMAEYTLEITVESKIIKQQNASDRFYHFIEEIWQPQTIYYTRQNEIKEARKDKLCAYSDTLSRFRTDYIVIGPTSSDLQRDTVNMFLDEKKRFISDDAVLLTVTPVKISGVKLDPNQFRSDYKPYKFIKLPHKVPAPIKKNLIWDLKKMREEKDCGKVEETAAEGETPQKRRSQPFLLGCGKEKERDRCILTEEGNGHGSNTGDADRIGQWEVNTGDTQSLIAFTLFTHEESDLPEARASAAECQPPSEKR